MTALTQGRTTHVATHLSAIDHALDGLGGADLHDAGDIRDLVATLTVLQRRLDAVALEAVRVLDATHAWQADGAASAAAWLRANLRLTPGAARQTVRTARRVTELPTMREALREGAISWQHVEVVTAAMKRNPARRDTIAQAEPTFATAARALDPHQLAKAVTRWTHLVDPIGAVATERELHEQRHLSVSRTFDGAVKLDGLFGPEQGAIVLTALEAVSTGQYRDAREVGGDERTAGQRRADGLVQLARRFLDAGDSGVIAGVRPHVTLTATVDTLASPPSSPGVPAAELDGVGPVSAEAARRISCDAQVGLLTLDARGAPLDYGRLVRTAPPRLRTAINVRDGGCVFPGCDRPTSWCEAHHIVHWSQGGETNLDNMALLCTNHHHTVHEGGFGMRGSPQHGTLRFFRPDGTELTDPNRGAHEPRAG